MHQTPTKTLSTSSALPSFGEEGEQRLFSGCSLPSTDKVGVWSGLPLWGIMRPRGREVTNLKSQLPPGSPRMGGLVWTGKAGLE